MAASSPAPNAPPPPTPVDQKASSGRYTLSISSATDLWWSVFEIGQTLSVEVDTAAVKYQHVQTYLKTKAPKPCYPAPYTFKVTDIKGKHIGTVTPLALFNPENNSGSVVGRDAQKGERFQILDKALRQNYAETPCLSALPSWRIYCEAEPAATTLTLTLKPLDAHVD
jgi:hypothetical protein